MKRTWILLFAFAFATTLLQGCRRDMQDQPRYKPLRPSRFFADERSARPLPAGTIARDEMNDADVIHTGLENGTFATKYPLPITKQLLVRGQQRYNIYCTPCHGFLGDGNGMIAKRGFKWPANLHSERLRNAPPGYLFQVVSSGYGAMPAYRFQIEPNDRWAILAYVRALQLSRNANITDLSPEGRAELEKQR